LRLPRARGAPRPRRISVSARSPARDSLPVPTRRSSRRAGAYPPMLELSKPGTSIGESTSAASLRGASSRLAADVDSPIDVPGFRAEEHTSELQARFDAVCRLLVAKKQELRMARKLHRIT